MRTIYESSVLIFEKSGSSIINMKDTETSRIYNQESIDNYNDTSCSKYEKN